ncbi:MAG: hypothetical protein ACRESJ_14330 [Pseudomonas sp.]|uniref:hypothetical protein n=1 Tax=Pseudomonas sp. TaxID=306 RepID=UPI003D6FD93D
MNISISINIESININVTVVGQTQPQVPEQTKETKQRASAQQKLQNKFRLAAKIEELFGADQASQFLATH